MRLRACRNPRRGREETGWRLFVLIDMSPLIKNRPKKQGPDTHTTSILCSITLLARPNVHACINMPTKRAQAQGTPTTHAAGCMLQRIQRHWSVRSRDRGMRFRRRSGAGGNLLYSRTQTHRTTRTRHAHNARPHLAVCNATSMRTNPHLTP